jgi:glycosyltransferase involved in cell wall biosynthesis
VPLQAAALDCMLILSNINGCNEIVEDGVNGMLVEPKSSKALTDAMFFARNNPDIKLQMTEKIRQKIRTHYNQETLWGLLLEEYRKRIHRN